MPTTIVHTADLHLETVFSGLRGGSARRAALADAFERIVDLAGERGADALTIGGDLYEAERAGPATARRLFSAFARFGKPVFVAPGNHDPFASRSLYARDDVPPNVRVFADAAWKSVGVAEGVTLFGFGHTPSEPGRPFEHASFSGSGVRLALVHGSDEERCPPGKRATAPFTASEIRASGATLALTGHYHGGSVVTDADGPILAYPGSPEPIKFGERGDHGVLIIRIDGEHVSVEPVPMARTRLLDVTVTLEHAGDEGTIVGRLEDALRECGPSDYVRATLQGTLEPGTPLDREMLAARCGSHLGALELIDRTSAADYAAIAHEANVRGRTVAELLASSDPAAARALHLVVSAFDGREIVA